MPDEKDNNKDRIGELLAAVERNEAGALEALTSEIYPELKRLAHLQLARERPGHTLSTTAIVHEAYIRLSSDDRSFTDRNHFFRVASTVMRHLLVDYARRRNADKRGGGVPALTLQEGLVDGTDDDLAVLALDDAIKEIATIDSKLEKIIECRCFAGLTVDETADVLGMSVRSTERYWRRARGYLTVALEKNIP